MKKTTKKKAAMFERELKDLQHVRITTCFAIYTMSTRQMKEVMRAHNVPIPKLRIEMIDRLAKHFGAIGAKVTVRIG